MVWRLLTLTAVLVSCVGVSDGFAQDRPGAPAFVPLNNAELCQQGRQDACARLRASDSSFEDDFENSFRDSLVGQGCRDAKGLVGDLELCDAAEDAVKKVGRLMDGLVDGVDGLVDGVDGLVDGVDGAMNSVGDALFGTSGPERRSPTDVRTGNAASGEVIQYRDIMAEMRALEAKAAAAAYESEKADDDARAWNAASGEASREHLAFQDRTREETSRRRAQRSERDAGIQYARSLTRTSERNIDYVQEELRTATSDYYQVRARSSAPSGGGSGAALASAFNTGGFNNTFSCDEVVRFSRTHKGQSSGGAASMGGMRGFSEEVERMSDVLGQRAQELSGLSDRHQRAWRALNGPRSAPSSISMSECQEVFASWRDLGVIDSSGRFQEEQFSSPQRAKEWLQDRIGK